MVRIHALVLLIERKVMFEVGNLVETVNGVGTIKEVRTGPYGYKIYLICTGKDGFGGDSDVYTEDEFVALDKSDDGV